MSIIQDALKKAQGDFSKKKAPQEKLNIAQVQPVNSEPVESDKRPLLHSDASRSPSMRLPALVSVLAILLLIYGFNSSLHQTVSRNNIPRVTKNSEEPAVNINPGTNAASIFGQANKLDAINFMVPRKSLFVLSGIMFTQDRPQAIINGHLLEEGDKIGGATILAIEEDCVLLDLNDENMRIELNKKD